MSSLLKLKAGAKAQLLLEAQFRYVPLSELPEPSAASASGEVEDPLSVAVTLPPPLEGALDAGSSTGTLEYFYCEAPLPLPPSTSAPSASASSAPAASSEDAPAASGDGAAAAALLSASEGAGAGAGRPPFARLLHIVPAGTKHPVQFGREMVCRLLAAPDRLSWKACALPTEAEGAQAEAFRAAFAPFDFTAEV